MSMTLMFTQVTGLRVSQNLCSQFVVKLPEATHMFVMIDRVREMTVKKSCKFAVCGHFEHLLFLFWSVGPLVGTTDGVMPVTSVLSGDLARRWPCLTLGGRGR